MKNIFLVLLSISVFSQVYAQKSESATPKFGFRAGYNYSLMNFNEASFQPTPAVKNIWKPGFTLCGLLQLRVSNLFTLQPEYAFTQMNGEDPRVNTSYRINYLSLPLLLKITFIKKLAFFAGPQFDLLVDGRAKTIDSGISITHSIEERSISVIAGVELQVYKSFFLDLRYLQGFNHIGIQRSGTNEFKWTSVTLAAGLHF